MAEPKTKPNAGSVLEFIDLVADEQKRKDSRNLVRLMEEETGAPAVLWGSSIVGFGSYRYQYPSGNKGEWMLTGFSPRKQALTIYIMTGFDKHEKLMQNLGTYKTGKSCLYIKKLADIDQKALRQLIKESIELLKKRYPK